MKHNFDLETVVDRPHNTRVILSLDNKILEIAEFSHRLMSVKDVMAHMREQYNLWIADCTVNDIRVES